jgi:hypothetical protein
MPLQHHGHVATNAIASLTILPIPIHMQQHQMDDPQLWWVLCWSNFGSVWKITMEIFCIRVRALERHQAGGVLVETDQDEELGFLFASAASFSSDR